MELFYILGLPLLTAVLSLFPAKNRNFPAALTIGAALLVLAAHGSSYSRYPRGRRS
ncbi:MAG: hypothetical protein ACPL7J_02560 [Desulfomonilaceae bacterium]